MSGPGSGSRVGSGPSWGEELHLRWVVGVSSALLSCGLSTVGFVMQRRAFLREGEQAEQWQRSTKLLWAAGVALYMLAAPPDLVAYAFAPHIVCTAVGCFRLVVLTVLADVFLGEKARAPEWLGMLTCSLGTFLCLHFGPKPNEEHISQHVEDAATQLRLGVYLVIGLAFLAVLLALEYGGGGCHYFTLPCAAALAFALEKVFNTEIGLQMHGHSLQQSLGHKSVWGMGTMIVSLGLLDFFLNLRGAKVLPVQIYVTMAFAIGTCLQYFQSMYVLGEFRHLSLREASLSLLGTAMALVGALLIQQATLVALCEKKSVCGGGGGEASSDSDGESDSDEDDDEESLGGKAAVSGDAPET